MAQYAVMIFERETPGGVADIPPEVLEAHGALPAQGRPSTAAGSSRGWHSSRPATATTIRGDLVTDGPFIESKEAMAGVFVLEARDLDHALALARMTPIMDGGVEVRPLLGFESWRRADPDERAARAGGRGRAPSRVGLRARRDGARHARPRRGGGERRRTPTSPALRAWARDGVPEQPGRLADDGRAAQRARRHRRRRIAATQAAAADRAGGERHGPEPTEHAIPDDRLRLIFTCCHPALARRRRSP